MASQVTIGQRVIISVRLKKFPPSGSPVAKKDTVKIRYRNRESGVPLSNVLTRQLRKAILRRISFNLVFFPPINDFATGVRLAQ